jgi:hypothetical protein
MLRRFIGASLVAAAVGFCVSPAHAVVTNWTVQSGSSSLALSGALSSGGTFLASVQGQSGATGGLSTSYTGSITTQQSIVGVSPADIQFLSALLDANVSGNWDPLPGGTTGTAAGDYGGKVDLGFLGGANLAVRNLTAGLSSGVISLVGAYTSPGAQTFLGNLDVSVLTATADYRGYGIVGGALGGGSLTDGIAGQSGSVLTAGTISYGPGGYAGTATLTIPVDFTFAAVVAGADTTDNAGDDIGVYIRLLGAVNATAATSAVPEASSLVLLGLAGSVVGFVGYRRKAKASA